MSSSDRLLLILHLGFAVFTLGPLTAATMATPRYIRRHDVGVLRYLTRATRIYGVATLGIFLFGLLLSHGDLARVWLSASMTLFVVALVLLVLVERDQRRAINALQVAIAAGRISLPDRIGRTNAAVDPAAGKAETATAPVPETGAGEEEIEAAAPRPAAEPEIARVERGRIASLSGIVALIWLVILFLMVWYGRQ